METGMEPNQSVEVSECVVAWPYLAGVISSGSFFFQFPAHEEKYK